MQSCGRQAFDAGHLRRFSDQPNKLKLSIVCAGPLKLHVVIAAALIFFLGRPADLEHVEQVQQPGVGMLAKLASVNVMLVLFNLIPAFPMDGGRVLRSLLAMTLPYARATQIAAWIGQALAFVFGFVGLFTNPMLRILGVEELVHDDSIGRTLALLTGQVRYSAPNRFPPRMLKNLSNPARIGAAMKPA